MLRLFPTAPYSDSTKVDPQNPALVLGPLYEALVETLTVTFIRTF